jgi:hypothetical protein
MNLALNGLRLLGFPAGSTACQISLLTLFRLPGNASMTNKEASLDLLCVFFAFRDHSVSLGLHKDREGPSALSSAPRDSIPGVSLPGLALARI